ncbi:MAG: type III-A CRISPR-associated protein Cas10/Csm1 [Desulfobulbaceae bacterium]|jgi:CRISPR-associated protein Csm1|nr:type III-A CRISPR-associated protein Cas10/Csm1 [Deltaproteobacteria bacterium]MDY0352276.1 type III-A CRISPR-associated protein Cas10/Csm1 [Desulfobulbaceae bacterium]
MNETVLKIALAGLLHDVGKFAQGGLEVSKDYLVSNAGLYQPFRDGHHSHIHAVYTAAFIEQMADKLPEKFNRGGWGEGDSFVNLAAGHHKPETPMQWIIAIADRISSGLDRATFEQGEAIAFKDYQRTRLLPVMEALGPRRITKFKSGKDFKYRYPLAPRSAQAIFPRKKEEFTQEQADQEYLEHFNGFIKHLANLQHRQESIALWAEHFDSLYMTYTAAIPAARVGDVIHDVSLYDHSRTTAAIAAALYRFHTGTDTLNDGSIRNGEQEKLLLISGDFYGIQDFIFSEGGETRKFRSKLLRGRSFSVSLFSELAADMVCRKLGLPFLSVVMNAAGKFHLIGPNLPDTMDTVRAVETEINDWLFTATYGQSSLGISFTPASTVELHSGRFADLWQRHLVNIEIRKSCKVDLNRHGGAVPMENYLDLFINDRKQVRRPLCPLCGKRPSDVAVENDTVFMPDSSSSCKLCRDHVFLGTNLVKKNMVAVFGGDIDKGRFDNRLGLPIFGEYQVAFCSNAMQKEAESGSLLKLWQVKADEDGTIPSEVTARLINGHVPLYREKDNQDNCLLESARSEEKVYDLIEQIREDVPKTFSHIAIKARRLDDNGRCRGIEALGVLEADVDNLGMLFGCGLPRQRFTISRLATLSRQINDFFVLYLPHLLATDETYYDVYTVFAGGDDLFLIGPWNRMAHLARQLNQRFNEYVCANSEITFSAGITVHKPHTPVDKLAEAAEDALKSSKTAGRDRVTMFGETVSWDDFQVLLDVQRHMEEWLAKKYISDAMFYRLNHFVDMAELEKIVLESEEVSLADMESLKWRALFKYNLVRNVDRRQENREKVLKEMGIMAVWLDQYRGAVRIPLWHVLYEKRK